MYRERRVGYIYVSAWGFFVVRSDELGNARASTRGTSNKHGLHVFFVYGCIDNNQDFRKAESEGDRGGGEGVNMANVIFLIMRCLGWFLSICSIICIYIINFTEWRPLGTADKYEEVNNVIVNLSYSYLAATIFHIVMIVLPELRRKKIMRNKIRSYFSRMKSAIKISITHIHLYSLELKDYKILPKEEFLVKFCSKNLNPPCDYLDLLKQARTKINLLIESLLTIQEYLSDKEINKLMKIKDSLFLTEEIYPKDYIINADGLPLELPNNNQKEMAESIYCIYELINKL